MTKAITFPNATRVTVVGDGVPGGRIFEQYGIWKNGAEIHIQDDGRTIKIFPKAKDEDDG